VVLTVAGPGHNVRVRSQPGSTVPIQEYRRLVMQLALVLLLVVALLSIIAREGVSGARETGT